MYLIETPHSSVPVEDLGLTVTRQAPVWVTPEQRQASDCLRQLEKMGRVRVSSKNRSRETREAPRRPLIRKRAAPPSRVVAPEPERTYSQHEVEALVEKAALRAAEAVSKRLEALAPSPASALPEDLEDRVTRAVGRALSQVSLAPGVEAAPRSAGPTEPLFIPEGIVRKGDQPEVSVQTESSDGGVEVAATALKKLRRKKKGDS